MGDNSQGQRNSPKPTNRGPAQSTRDGDYPALASYFDCFSTSFTRDLTLHPEHDFRHLQEQKNWKIGSSIYNEQRRQFLTAVVAESQSPVHAFFIGHPTFLEYDTTASPVHELSRLQRQIDGPVDHAAYDAAFLAEFHGPLDSFFREYPVLDYNPHGPPMGEFRRLVSASGWDPERAKRRENARTPESRAYRRARTAFFDAFRNEFDSLFGSDVEDFATWKSLCETLGVNPVPDTVTQCRKVSKLVVDVCASAD